MSETEKKPEAVAITDDIGQDAKGLGTMPKAEDKSPEVDIARLTDKWKRALADAENTRKRGRRVVRGRGCEHGIALAVEALAPALDALALGIEARASKIRMPKIPGSFRILRVCAMPGRPSRPD